MIKFVKDNLFYFLGFLVLLLAVVVNIFPKGFVLAGGDVAQLINIQENFGKFFYDWEGRTVIFYAPFYLLNALGLSETNQLSVYLGVFIFGSYISFDIFTRLVFKKTSNFLRALISLIYALNLYTLYIFSYNWGYSAYQSLYIFIPVLCGLYFKFLTTQKFFWGGLFVLTLALASSGFGNPAFALSFFIFLLVLTVFLAAVKLIVFDKNLLKKIALLGVFSLLVNIYWILPILPQMKAGVSNLFSGNIIDLNWWLRHTSNPVIDTFRLMQYNNWYFPDNFPYQKLFDYRYIFTFLTLLPIFFISAGWILSRKFNLREKKLFIIFLGVFLVLVMLVAKVRPPFEKINHFFYNIWGMNTLRGYEKFAIFTPFVISVLLLITAINQKDKLRKGLVAFGLSLILITPLPFYMGKLHQNMSAVFVRDTVKMEAKNYQKAKYSFLVKIPDEYYNIRDIINNDPDEVKIATLPYNVVDSIGWSNYPKWKLAGTDITRRLYNKSFISANSFYFNDWLFAKDFGESSADPEWIARLLGMMNAKYVIFHKDAEQEFIEQTEIKINKLKREGYFKLINENDFFSLYKIKKDLVAPVISWQSGKFNVYPAIASLNYHTKEIIENSLAADFQKINPKKYIIYNVQNRTSENLIFSERYNKNWKAFAYGENGEKIKLGNHYKARGYANGWEIGRDLNISKIVIEFYPMKLAYWGIAISGLAFLTVIIYLLKHFYDEKRKR